MSATTWPAKTRELRNQYVDSTIWNDFRFRDDEVIVASYMKAGTTWVQQIVMQLVHGGDPGLAVSELSPWLDLRIPPKEEKLSVVEALTQRRVIKTHLPVDALVYSPTAKYIYTARDARDVVWSMYHHHSNANQTYYDLLNHTPGRIGPPIARPSADVLLYWREWLSRDGHPFWPFWDSVRSWWAIRDLPNLLLAHFNDLKRDLPGQMRRIAQFLDARVDPSRWDAVQTYCSFDWMKRNAAQYTPLGGAVWEGGGETFFNKGTNGAGRTCSLRRIARSTRRVR